MKVNSQRSSCAKSERPQKLDPSCISFDERLRYTVPEASALLRQSRAKTYLDIKNGKLRPIRDGARTYIPGSEIHRRSRFETAA